jgi:hypothetical protein
MLTAGGRAATVSAGFAFQSGGPAMRSVRWLLALAITFVTVGVAGAVDPPRTGVAGLADRLKTGLRVQTPRDQAFCDAVAERVRAGRIPADLVDATFTWAIARGRKYPFPAFEHVMRIKAAKLGVSLDQRP